MTITKPVLAVALALTGINAWGQWQDEQTVKEFHFDHNDWLQQIDPPWQARVDQAQVVPTPGAPMAAQSLRVNYPKGAVGPREGGVQYPIVFANVAGVDNHYQSLSLHYCLKFEKGFDFVKGGKLPGLMGGGDSWSRSGGQQPDGTNGWTLRYMWRAGGEAVVYAYLPPSPNGRYGGGTWGQDIPLNKTFTPGQWHCLTQRVQLNDLGRENGELQVWMDGEKVLDRNDITYRLQDTPAGRIGGVYISTFHGGNTQDWAPARDSTLLFNGFAVGHPQHAR